MKTERIQIGDVEGDVEFKDIKNIHLAVHPPTGRVRIAAPARMKLDTVRMFAISKLGWIRQQQRKLNAQEREPRREYRDRESHYLWGRRYLLKVVEADQPPSVEVKHRWIHLQVRPGTDTARRNEIMQAWYRDRIREEVPALLAQWAPLLGVEVSRVFIQRMKTRWGGCNPIAGNIRFNTELAKKPPESLEYIAVHEMVHLLEPTHNDRFVALMDRYMRDWRHRRDALNQLPVAQQNWGY